MLLVARYCCIVLTISWNVEVIKCWKGEFRLCVTLCRTAQLCSAVYSECVVGKIQEKVHEPYCCTVELPRGSSKGEK